MLVVLSVAKKSKGVILRYTFAIYDGRVYDITEQTAGKSKGWIMTKKFLFYTSALQMVM